ncbi:peptidase inhibitor family I36 protein [Streptomyces kanamyceticus]|uniref:peptidase inhibitor family I36 protein n=1 Tax=Streptomyces kanamyceticus TaxID=1967 RepID=UPI0012FE8DD0|nr:peptidase inhibitor family I36 protein [Streptomyces kanamyceticus]
MTQLKYSPWITCSKKRFRNFSPLVRAHVIRVAPLRDHRPRESKKEKMMRRGIIAGISSIALAGGALLGVAQTATASETGAQASYLWLYQHDSYGGSSKNFSGDDRYLSDTYWNGTSSKVDNGASSMKNQTSRDIVLWQDNGCSGDQYFARPNSSDKDFSNNNFDNKASCVDFR